MPVMPQKLAGWRIDPPVSVPVAAGTSCAATAAAEPPDEPPGTRPGSHGLRAGPKAEFSFPRLVLTPDAREHWRTACKATGDRPYVTASSVICWGAHADPEDDVVLWEVTADGLAAQERELARD
jgi:hypothetical protein